MAGHIATSARIDWCSPEDPILSRVRRVFGGEIDLDPCPGGPDSVVRARWEYRLPKENGLKLAWGGRVYWNPPFGRSYVHPGSGIVLGAKEWKALREADPAAAAEYVAQDIGEWVEKAYAERRKRGAESIGLIPAAVDTRPWRKHIARGGAAAVCFPEGRLKFIGAAASAPMACALPYYGPRPWVFHEVFSEIGWVVCP